MDNREVNSRLEKEGIEKLFEDLKKIVVALNNATGRIVPEKDRQLPEEYVTRYKGSDDLTILDILMINSYPDAVDCFNPGMEEREKMKDNKDNKDEVINLVNNLNRYNVCRKEIKEKLDASKNLEFSITDNFRSKLVIGHKYKIDKKVEEQINTLKEDYNIKSTETNKPKNEENITSPKQHVNLRRHAISTPKDNEKKASITQSTPKPGSLKNTIEDLKRHASEPSGLRKATRDFGKK
jgi:hypothetical protein